MRIKILLFLIIFSIIGCKSKFNIGGEKVSSKDVCGKCNPGFQGRYMLMTKSVYTPVVEKNITPKEIAHSIIGSVIPDGIRTGKVLKSCSSNSVVSPFSLNDIKITGNYDGTDIKYFKNETLQMDVNAAVDTELDNIRTLYPNLDLSKLNALKAELNLAYSKFNNSELSITGKYYEFVLDNSTLQKLARDLDYTDCKSYFTRKDNNRMVVAVGLVLFNFKNASNDVDSFASELNTLANSYGINYQLGASFKNKISKEVLHSKDDFFQVVVWRTIGIKELNELN